MPVPRDSHLDSSFALLREGYDFIGNRCRRLRSPVFQSRILLQRTYCLQGHDAAAMFYENPNLSRVGAAPRMLVKTLFGAGAIQGMDGPAHHARKALFIELLTRESAARLVESVEQELLDSLDAWVAAESVDVLSELQGVLYRAVNRWAGVPAEQLSARHQAQLVALIEGAGSAGLEHFRGRSARKQAERWGAELIEAQRRAGGTLLPADSPAAKIAAYRENAELLAPRVAAVELLNVLRPIVAVAYFVLYGLVELARHPQWRESLQENDRLLLPFVQEVRRLYAFFPFTAARVVNDFQWQGLELKRGSRVLLDLYGSNRDPKVWPEPDRFHPPRFVDLPLDAYTLISQGGGDHHTGHRCAGEWLTIDIMQTCLRVLCRRVRYQAPVIEEQPLRNCFPMKFSRRFEISRVQWLAEQRRSSE